MSDYELVPIDQLTPHPDNARKGNVEEIADSISAHGFYGALVVQRSTNRIIVGNHRYDAAVRCGLDAVPVTWVDVDDEQARRIMLMDNRTSDRASYDDRRLLELLGDLPDLDGTGYDDDDLDDLMALIDEAPPITVPTPLDDAPPVGIPPQGTPGEGAWVGPSIEDQKDAYVNRTTRAIVLDYTISEYEEVVSKLTALRSALSLETNAEVVRALILDRAAKA